MIVLNKEKKRKEKKRKEKTTGEQAKPIRRFLGSKPTNILKDWNMRQHEVIESLKLLSSSR
jgi:hypothetical protein